MADDARLQVVLEAKIDKLIDKLSAANRAVHGASSKMQQDIEAANSKWERMFLGEGPGKALEKVFSRSRFALVEEGGAKIGVFGSALEALGPAGIAAAVGVVALAEAMHQAKEAIEFASHLEHTAKQLHVTTDALQEYRYAIRLAGGEESGADEALAGFSVTLGKAQAGLPRALKAFKELGFTKDQVKSFTDVQTALDAVTQKISGLGKNAQKDAVIEQLGLTGLKPLIEDGADAMVRLREEARKAGIVMDEGLVKRGAEANEKYETLAKVIDVQLKSAFVDLAPIIVGLVGLVAKLAAGISELVDKFRDVKERREDVLKTQRQYYVDQNNSPFTSKVAKVFNNKSIADIDAELARREAEKKPPPVPTGGNLVDLEAEKEAAAAAKAALERKTRGEEAIDSALRDELRARLALVTGIREQATLASDEVDAETKKKNDKLRSEVALKQMNKVDADRAIALNNTAAAEKKIEIDRTAEARIVEDGLNLVREITQNYDQIASNEAAMAASSKERRAIELRRLRADQRVELQGFDKETDLGKVGKTGTDLETYLLGRASQRASVADRQASDEKATNYQTRSPLQVYQDELKNLDDTIQNDAISAFRSLADSIGDTTAKLLHLKGPLGQFFGQLISLLVQRQGSGLLGGLLGAIPHFASGTSFAPGGLSLVGEQGPELVSLPRGAGVIPNTALSSLNGLGVPNRAAVTPVLVLDMKGAVVTEELMRQANETAARFAAQAGTAAYQAARRDIPALAAQRAGSRMGRG